MVAALKKCEMNQLATELRQWVEGAAFTEQLSKESKLEDTVVFYFLLILCQICRSHISLLSTLFSFYRSRIPSRAFEMVPDRQVGGLSPTGLVA